MAGLSVGLSSIYCFDHSRVGRASQLSSLGVAAKLRICMSNNQQRRDRGAQGRLVCISRALSRALRHGTKRHEKPIPSALEDGGSILASEVLVRPTFQKLETQRADVVRCASEKNATRKLRFDLYQSAGGKRIRAYQGHSLNVTAPEAYTQPLQQHYVLHAANMRADVSILRDGFMLQQSGRNEFHFVECSFNTRQQQYLRDSSGRKGVWVLVDARVAARLGSHFRLLPNGVVVTTGHVGRIDKQCIVSVWENEHTMLEMDGLLKETPELIIQNSENVYHAPCRRDRLCVDTAYVPLSSEGAASPDKRNRPRSAPPQGVQAAFTQTIGVGES